MVALMNTTAKTLFSRSQPHSNGSNALRAGAPAPDFARKSTSEWHNRPNPRLVCSRFLLDDSKVVGYCKLLSTRADLEHQVFKQGRYNCLACSIHRFRPRTQKRLRWRKLDDRHQSPSSGGRRESGGCSTRHRQSFLSAERSLMSGVL